MTLREELHEAVDEILDRYHASLDDMNGIRVVVDAGHGGHDRGGNVPNADEADMVLIYALALADELESRGAQVLMTRVEDAFVALGNRAAKANEWGCDCFISVHANVSGNVTPNGCWVIHAKGSERGRALAREVFRALETLPGLADADAMEEVYPDDTPWVGNRRLAVLRQTHAPAILIELGFLTNKEDLSQLREPETPVDVARAVAEGIFAWTESDE